jgi:hypothetical protein
MLKSILTLGIFETPCDSFWKEWLLILAVLMALRLMVTGVTCTSPRWKGYESYLILPF